MSFVQAVQICEVARGELNTICIDWGSTTAGQETGVLKAGDLVESCTVYWHSGPTGAVTPTLGSVSVNTDPLYINRRLCAEGEATLCNITLAADQLDGLYRLVFTATTVNGKIIPRFIRIKVAA